MNKDDYLDLFILIEIIALFLLAAYSFKQDSSHETEQNRIRYHYDFSVDSDGNYHSA